MKERHMDLDEKGNKKVLQKLKSNLDYLAPGCKFQGEIPRAENVMETEHCLVYEQMLNDQNFLALSVFLFYFPLHVHVASNLF